MTKTTFTPSLFGLFAALLLSPLAGCRHDDGVPPTAHEQAARTSPSVTPAAEERAPPKNAVQHEMQLLLAALQGTVAAIADDDLARIPKLIHGAHAAKDQTEAAIADGSYRLPKNHDQLPTFKALDEVFHNELIALVKAARADDLAATTTQLGRLLGQCNGCHTLFREMPAPRSSTSEPAPEEAHSHP